MDRLPAVRPGHITLTATAKDVRETGAVSFLTLPRLAAALLPAGGAAGLVGRRIRRPDGARSGSGAHART
ncbi:hypothetical protein ABZ567_03405 [Streptomyces sp. NPDC016459]|uniref:hypothetical protein n=1 Tax=Streptomyces sp. NPDC016459 TaxID=3157190 RepID=UPI0033CC587F